MQVNLGNAVHYLWSGMLDLQHAKFLNTLNYSVENISYKIFWPETAENLHTVDQVHFPAFATERLVLLQMLILGTEKLFKGLLIFQGFIEKKKIISINGNAHNLGNLWNLLPESIFIKILHYDYRLSIKPPFYEIADMPAFLNIDYNTIRYGVDKEFKVSKEYDFQISYLNLTELIKKLIDLNNTAGSSIFSMNPELKDFPTGQKYPRLFLGQTGKRGLHPPDINSDRLRFTNKPIDGNIGNSISK